MLRRVGAKLQGRDADIAGDFAVFDDHIANDSRFAAKGEHATAALIRAVANADVLDGRTVSVVCRMGSLGAFARDAVVGNGEEAAVDRDVARTVDVDAVGARSLPVVVGDFEANLVHEYAVAVVEMQIPELRILERDAFDLHPARAFNQRHTRARDAEVRKVSWIRRCVALLPELVPDGPPR